MKRQKVINRLKEIKESIAALVTEAETLVEDYAGVDSDLYQKAAEYWICDFANALESDSHSMSLADTIFLLEEAEAEYEDIY